MACQPLFIIERVYEEPKVGHYRVLVDRLWPRGVTKERAALNLWAKEIAPSTELRVWYGHVPKRFDEFERRYRQELNQTSSSRLCEDLIATAKTQNHSVALVTATRDIEHSGAIVLSEVLSEIATAP